MLFQYLKLEKGQKARCTAGYPKKVTVIVECIKDFSSAKEDLYIVDNATEFVKIVNAGRFNMGLLTSHLISSSWEIIN